MEKCKNYKSLELNAILLILSNLVKNMDAKNEIFKLEPQSDIEIVEKMLNETVEAYSLLAKYQVPSFTSLYEVKHMLNKSKVGSVLNLS